MRRPGAREVVTGALLTALALLIPLLFRGTLQIAIGPYSATLASWVIVQAGLDPNFRQVSSGPEEVQSLLAVRLPM
ncbi:MAG TPA: hypothetical protein VIK92_04645 [Thermaerobacter sp.]